MASTSSASQTPSLPTVRANGEIYVLVVNLPIKIVQLEETGEIECVSVTGSQSLDMNIGLPSLTYDAPSPSGKITYKFEPGTTRVWSEYTYVSPSIFHGVVRVVLLGVIPVSKRRPYDKYKGERRRFQVHRSRTE